jgi:hypothetical protein
MTAPNSAPEGESSTDDDAAQQALADAAREAGDESDGDEDDDEQFDSERARRKIDKANREAKALRDRIKALEPLAQEAEKRRKGEMTEAQKLTEQKTQLEAELNELRAVNTRRDAAEAANLPARFVKFITATDANEALAQAKELAKELKGTEERKSSPDLLQGARGANNAGATQNPDDLLRQMARQR